MSDQNDVIGEILDEMQRIEDSGAKVASIVIHDAGLWARLPELAGAQFVTTPGGKTLFGVPADLGFKNGSAKFTVGTDGSEINL